MRSGRHEVVILDGGTGREIQNRGLARRGSIWSALALMEAPAVVSEVHQAFVDAGAQVVITNNYSVVPTMLARESLTSRFDELTTLSGEIAAAVRDSSDRMVRVAGSLPPLNDSYQPTAVGPEEENLKAYRRIVSNLTPFVDLFVCETMSTGLEARAAARAAAESGKPVWVAWTLSRAADGTLRSGETVRQVYDLLDGFEVDAYLFNCSTPEAISAALPELRSMTDKPIGAYANAFDGKRRVAGETPLRGDMDPHGYAELAAQWRASGCDIIGGCCGISPDHIAALAQKFSA